MFDSDFVHASNVNDKEALFIPTGFDNPEMIDLIDLKKFMENNSGTFELLPFDSVIKRPAGNK